MPVLSVRCSSYSNYVTVDESLVRKVVGFQLRIQLWPDHEVTYEIRRSYAEFVEFDILIREKLRMQNLKFPLHSPCFSDAANSANLNVISQKAIGTPVSEVDDASASNSKDSVSKESFNLTSYWLGFTSKHQKQAETGDDDYNYLVEDFDFYLQDLLSRHEVLASEDFALFLDPSNQSRQNESNNRDLEHYTSIHEYILRNSKRADCHFIRLESRAYVIQADEIILWKFLGCQTEFIVELNGVRKMSYITSKSSSTPQYGALVADEGGTCVLTWIVNETSS